MARLVLTLNGSYFNEYALTHAKTTIGRKSSNDIHLDNLAISGEHAIIVKQGEDFFLEDLNSTNGTRINSTIVKKQVLKNDDVIELGRFNLTFLNNESSAGADAFEKTMMVHPSSLGINHSLQHNQKSMSAPVHRDVSSTHISSKPLASRDSVSPISIGKIQVLSGSSTGRELVLNKTLTTLGKTGVQVAVITKRPNGYFITHVEGKALPMVNGVSTGMQGRELLDHDVIELAGVKMEFYLTNA